MNSPWFLMIAGEMTILAPYFMSLLLHSAAIQRKKSSLESKSVICRLNTESQDKFYFGKHTIFYDRVS